MRQNRILMVSAIALVFGFAAELRAEEAWEAAFEEAAELAYFGAKILHPSSVTPAKKADIPVRLKNTLNPKALGTLLTSQETGEGIKAIAAKEGITVIKIKSGRMLLAYGFMRKVFEIFDIEKMIVSENALREGIIIETIKQEDEHMVISV